MAIVRVLYYSSNLLCYTNTSCGEMGPLGSIFYFLATMASLDLDVFTNLYKVQRFLMGKLLITSSWV